MADSPALQVSGEVRFTISSSGAVIPDDIQFISFTIRASTGSPAEAVLVIADGDVAEETFWVSEGPTFVPGTAIGIAAGYDGGTAEREIFAGKVVSQRVVVSPDGGSRLEVTCRADSPKPAIPAERLAPILRVVFGIDLVAVDMSMVAPRREWFPSARGTLRFPGSATAEVGTGIEVDGLGKRFNGTYPIRAVTHILAAGTWWTEVTVGAAGAQPSGGTEMSATSPR